MKKYMKFLLLILIFLGSFLNSTIIAAHTTEGREVVVHMDAQGFDPSKVTINQGDKVIFENIGTESRWPASNIHPTHRSYPESDIQICGTPQAGAAFDACDGVLPGGTFEFVFVHAGQWPFHDHINPQLKGSITVIAKEAELGSQQIVTTEPEPGPPKSFLKKFLHAIENIIFKIMALFSGWAVETDDKKELNITRPYNENISEDIELHIGAPEDLYSYVVKFGPSKATLRLHSLEHKFGDCHTAAHDVGNAAYEVYDARAFQLCSAECHSGCYHGAAEMYFREHGTADLTKDLKIICSSELNSFYSHQCIHGIGHGLMAWADYDLPQALQNCDLLPASKASCYSGVYMENIVGGLAPEQGHFTEYLSEDPHFPCNVVEDKYQGACYFYQTSRMVQLFGGDFSKVAETCAEADARYHRSCFESMGRDVGGYNRGNPAGAIAACRHAPEGNARNWCLSGAVQDSFWDPSGQDLGLQFCKILTEPAQKDICYATIFGRATQVLVSSDDLRAFCKKAEEIYQAQCLAYVR
jgi:plastocyanin